MKRTIVSLIALPGAGKSSLGKRSAELLGMDYISSGDIARDICAKMGSDMLEKGEMGPEHAVRKQVAAAIRLSGKDIILDGMPRHLSQLEWFKTEFADFDLRYVYVDVPRKICEERMIARGREENLEAIQKRLNAFTTNTVPLLDMVWASTFKPAPYANEDYVAIDFCRFLLSSRTVERRVKIKLLPDHPLYGKSEEEIEKYLGGVDATNAFLFKKYKGDAGLDLFVSKPVKIPKRGKVNISTSIAIEIPPFYWYNIDKRSSTYYVRDMLVIEAVIDNGYRGELFCTVHNPSDKDHFLNPGESVAQIIFHELVGYDFKLELVNELSDSDRKDNGFGSTTGFKDIIQSMYQEQYDAKKGREAVV